MSRTEKTKFTVIIPTRERCDVLESSLRTCVSQDYENLEIIVSDNFSQDRTKEVVESFKDSRIRYINTGKRLSMSHNWEFALSHVESGYVMFLGDDDGLLPGALTELDEIIRETGCEAISWKLAQYIWPDCINETTRNMLGIPLQSSLVKRNTGEMLTEVISFKRHYLDLPTLYKGFVRYNIIEKIKQPTGFFFHSMTPDIYSGIALACVLETYYYSFRPYSLNGASHHSTGTACFSSSLNKQAADKFLSEENIPFHNKLVMVPSIPILVAECFLQAQEHLSSARRFNVDMKKVLQNAVKEAKYRSHESYEKIIEAVREIASINQLEDYVSEIISTRKHEPKRSFQPVLGVNLIRDHISVDCTEFEVRNVYEASQLCKYILTTRKRDYFSLKEILKTTVALLKREILKRGFFK